MSRAYYAMFYAAEALLLSEGLSFSKHSAVIAAFGQHCAKTGRVPEKFHRYPIEGEGSRNVGDYDIGPGLSETEAQQRLLPMNSISWNVGHLAWQEQRYWLFRGQNRVLLPHLNDQFANGAVIFTIHTLTVGLYTISATVKDGADATLAAGSTTARVVAGTTSPVGTAAAPLPAAASATASPPTCR